MAEGTPTYEQEELKTESIEESIVDALHTEVAAMNLDNFIVRPMRKYVEHFQSRGHWEDLSKDKILELHQHIAGLPSEQEPENIEAKLFDLTCLKLQIGTLRPDTRFRAYQQQIMSIAANLEEKETIPMVKKQMALIQQVQSEEFWENITIQILENVRKKLRDLVQFVDKRQREPVYSVLQDEIGEEEIVELDNFQTGINLAQYKKKVEQYIRSNENHLSIHKLKFNEPLTQSDLEELERFLFETGEAQSKEQLEEAFGEQESLPLFIRSFVGLDQSAAKEAFGNFLTRNNLNTSQMAFVDLIINYLTQKGYVDPAQLYEEPFTGLHFEGLDGVFPDAHADEIISILESIQRNAAVWESPIHSDLWC